MITEPEREIILSRMDEGRKRADRMGSNLAAGRSRNDLTAGAAVARPSLDNYKAKAKTVFAPLKK